MKRIIPLILALLQIFSCTALAEEPVFSPEVEALYKANAALMDKYGHTHATLGLFAPKVHLYGETALVTYAINDGNVSAQLAGEYFVLNTEDIAHAFWSHDDADAALWQSGDLNSPAWGVKQLTAYLDESPMTRFDFCEPYASAHHPSALNSEYAAAPIEPVSKDNRAAAEQAAAQARIALQRMYGLSDEIAARLDWYADMSYAIHYRDGHSEWFLMLQDNADVLDPISYTVTLDAKTHQVMKIRHASGGVG